MNINNISLTLVKRHRHHEASRHDQIAAYTGVELARALRSGNLLVSTRESSRENLELIAKHPEVSESHTERIDTEEAEE